MLQRFRNVLTGMNLTERYILTSLVLVILGILSIGWWVSQQITNGVIHRTSATTALFVDSFISSHLQELATTGQISSDHAQMLDQLLNNSSLGQQIVAFKVWDSTGVVQFSTDKSAVGISYPIENGLAQALNGEVSSKISDLKKAENVGELTFGNRLIETYLPVRQTGTDRIIAVAEFYQKVDELQGEITAAQIRTWLVVAGSMLVIFILLSGYIKIASNTIDRQKVELSNQVIQLTELLKQNQALHERVRRASASVTTINERLLRRIGSELHDGPAQDLSLALLNLDTAIGQSEGCKLANPKGEVCNGNLTSIQTSLQNALKELRAISTGLGLPELAAATLPETIVRVVHAHERRTNTKVNLDLGELPEQFSLSGKIMIYRLIQEALNNSFRHAQGIGQSVAVHVSANQIVLEISDRGSGFDAQEAMRLENHLGIIGMRERVESLGGYFSIESKVGIGTKVTARLNLQAEGVNHG